MMPALNLGKSDECGFELIWILSSMLSSGFSVEDFDPASLERIDTFLQETFKLNDGIIGMVPGLLPDVGDTVRTLMALELIFKRTRFTSRIPAFEPDDHFRTYDFERDPSFSAKCNVLIALTYNEDVDQYSAQIAKALKFVLEKFEQGDVSDKWKNSPRFSTMLMAQALVQCLDICERGRLQEIDKTLVDERISVAICRILQQTVSGQSTGGSWNNSIQETSYSILTLTQCQRIPWNLATTSANQTCLERGRDYLRLHYGQGEKSKFSWAEKAVYKPNLLELAYCSIAIHDAGKPLRSCTTKRFVVPEMQAKRMTYLLSALPNFVGKDLGTVDMVLAEANQLSRFLRRRRDEIVVRDQIPMTKDRYLDFIPVIWTMCNAKAKHVLPIELVREMVHISLLNYQIDEYMETIVGEMDNETIKEIVNVLRKDFESSNSNSSGNSNRFEDTSCENDVQSGSKCRKIHNEDAIGTNSNENALPSMVEQALIVLRRCISHILGITAVLASPQEVQCGLEKEVYTFILAHIAHNADNHALQQGSTKSVGGGFSCSDIERNSYYKWVNSTGADDTSCPFQFQLFACLISHSLALKNVQHRAGHASYCFPSAHAQYVAVTVARRLAAMCRMYNDYGSAGRDKDEGNLNSLDFNEFCDTCMQSVGTRGIDPNGHGHDDEIGRDKSDGKAAKDQLMAIAEFEREGVEHAMATLEKLVPDKRVMTMLRVFVDVTDTFGLVYVQKDIASTRLHNGQKYEGADSK